jgi:hypothetical protein
MLLTDIPSKFNNPFGYAAGVPYISSPVPATTGTPGRAALDTGFPPLNFQPRGAGGIPPFGQDINGLMFQTTGWARWLAAGGAIFYDAAFATAIGGYPKNCVLQSTFYPGLLWRSLVDNNTSDPDSALATGWARASRATLSADTIFYVSPAGSNTNNGLTALTPFQTIQFAIDTLTRFYDLNNFQVTIQLADGTYPAGATISNLVGQGSKYLIINGNISTPANVVVQGTINSGNTTGVTIQYFRFSTTGSIGQALAASGGVLNSGQGMDFGPSLGGQGSHIYANGGTIQVGFNYTISGGANAHFQIFNSGKILLTPTPITVTLTGTPAFTGAFCTVNQLGNFNGAGGLVTVGSATGPRYSLDNFSFIFTGSGGSATFFPGNVAGTNFGHGSVYN